MSVIDVIRQVVGLFFLLRVDIDHQTAEAAAPAWAAVP